MKLVSALKKMCEHCFIVRKSKKVYVRCKVNPRHKQRQGSGFSSMKQYSGDQSSIKIYYQQYPEYYLDVSEFLKKLPYM